MAWKLATSFEIRYLKVKLWGIHSMILRDLPRSQFCKITLKLWGRKLSTISNKPCKFRLASFANHPTNFGKMMQCSFRIQILDLMYSSFAISSWWYTLFELYTRTCMNFQKKKKLLLWLTNLWKNVQIWNG